MKRPPKPMTAQRLVNITGHYLERFATSRAHLGRLLMRRVHRAAEHHGTDPAEGTALVEAELDRLEQLGLLDDHRFAKDKTRTLRRRGASNARVWATLGAKGVSREAIASVLAPEEGENPQYTAALAFLRRRRAATEAVALARLVRAGFPYGVARKALAEDRAAQED